LSVEENKAVVRRFFEEVLARKRPELVEEFLADGVADHNKVVFAGPDAPGGMAEGVRMLLVAFPDLRATVKRQVSEGDYVSTHLAMAATNTGPYPRVPEPTGRHTEWESMVLFRMEGSRIAELWGTSDRMGMLTQLGILPDIGQRRTPLHGGPPSPLFTSCPPR
jgi:predicted ester cyclase